MAQSDFWANKERAQTLVEELSVLRSKILPFQGIERQLADFELLFEMAQADEFPRTSAGGEEGFDQGQQGRKQDEQPDQADRRKKKEHLPTFRHAGTGIDRRGERGIA